MAQPKNPHAYQPDWNHLNGLRAELETKIDNKVSEATATFKWLISGIAVAFMSFLGFHFHTSSIIYGQISFLKDRVLILETKHNVNPNFMDKSKK
jgi:hypothetical protein